MPEENGDIPISLTPEELEEEDIIEEPLEPEEDPAECIFQDAKGYVTKDEADRISQQGFYGSRLDDGRLEIEPVEILHLLERKRIMVQTEDGEPIDAKYIVNKMLPMDSELWVRYLVFRDLRSRGYAVRQGFGGGIGFRVYARGARPGVSEANQLIYVLKEGDPISLHDLDAVTESASAARKKLVFALVDQNGEVNYYRVAQAALPKRGGEQDEQ
ncbi:MAG: tRNA-intron lyase [Candidatus Hodarchaeota archaeon]